MELYEGIVTRRSVRAFKADPIPKEVLEKILQAAGQSPSFLNTQPWEVAVVSGKKKEELSDILYEIARADTTPTPDIPAPENWPPELERRSREYGAARLELAGIDRADEKRRKESRWQNFKFYGAPCAIFLLMDSTLTAWSIFDLGLFAENLSLAAHSFGLGSCLQAGVVNYPDAIREFLRIPKTKLLVLGISIGYPDTEAKINTFRSNKASINDFTTWYT